MFFSKAVVALSMAVVALAVPRPEIETRQVSGTHTGDATFYETGLGACGITNTDSDFIAAASHILFDSFPGYAGGDPNANPICGKTLTASYAGKQVTVAITDRCVSCAEYDLDFSPSAFQQLADLGVGRLHGMTWQFDN